MSKRYDFVYIRVIATILVVLGHSWYYNGFSGFDQAEIPGALTGTVLYNINKFIYTFHMPLFFAVSGSLLAYGIQKTQAKGIKTYLKKKAWRLLLPFVIITLFYCLPIKFYTGYYDFNSEFLKAIFEQLIFAKGAHTWFLLALFWCMLYSIPLVFLTKKQATITFLLLLLVHFIGIPGIFGVFGDVLLFRKGLAFIPFFLLGFYVEKYKVISKYNQTFNIGLWALLCFILFESLYFFIEIPKDGIVFSRLSLLIKDIVGASCIIVFYSYFQSGMANSTPPLRTLFTYLDKKSFQIYLYSEPLNYLILYWVLQHGGWAYGGVSLYWVRFFLTFLGALLLSWLIRPNFGQK